MPKYDNPAREAMYGYNQKMEEYARQSIAHTKQQMAVRQYDYSKASTLKSQESGFISKAKEIARECISIVNKEPLLKKDDLDCSSAAITRRARAITAFTQAIHEKFSEAYPHLCVEDVFMWINEPSNIFTIDHLDRQHYVSYAISLWILDELQRTGRINEAVNYLPDVDDELGVGMPPFMDSRHNSEIIEKMMSLIRNRNSDTNKDTASKRIIIDKTTLLLKGQREYRLYPFSDNLTMRQRFDSVISLINPHVIARSTARYEENSWRFVDIILKLINQYRTLELSACREHLDLLQQELENLSLSNHAKDNHGSVLLMNNLVGANELMSGLDNKMKGLELSRKALEADGRQNQYANLQQQIAFLAYSPDFLEMMVNDGSLVPGDTDDVKSFEVQNPYETLFALFYLFDSGSDIAWLYNQSMFMEAVAISQLPWAFMNIRKRDWPNEPEDGEDVWYDDSDDTDDEESFEETSADDNENIEPIDWIDEEIRLYRKDYNDACLWMEPDKADREKLLPMNLAQIIFENTQVVMPRDGHLEYDTAPLLVKSGFEEKEAKALERYFTLARSFEYKEIERNRLTEPIETEEEEEVTVPEEIVDTFDYKGEVTRLKEEIRSLHSERNTFRKHAETLASENEELQKQIEELRTLLQTERQGGSKDTGLKTHVTYPYSVRHRYVVFGGHPSWRKEIKKLLPNVRFIDADTLSSPELILNADAVWIQSNAIGHDFYYKILNVTRTHNKPLEYFSFASAEKCAEQIAVYDMKQSS